MRTERELAEELIDKIANRPFTTVIIVAFMFLLAGIIGNLLRYYGI